MNTRQLAVELPEVQGAIYGVALSLDAFLLNGIQYGVLEPAVFNGFLQKVAGNLLRDLVRLEEQASHACTTSQPQVTEALAALRARCQELIDLVSGLGSFRTLSLEQLRSTVAQIPHLRQACVQLLQELEGFFQTPQRFYQSRPAHSTAAVNDFLANLERSFVQEWHASAEHGR
jgi:hypothetical protein